MITTMDGLLNAMPSAGRIDLFFPSATNVAGGLVNLNQAVVSGFGQLSVPAVRGSGGTKFNQSGQSSGVPKWSAAAVGEQSYLARAQACFATIGALHVYDLLWAASGFSGAVITAQAVTEFTGLPARSDGAGVQIWVGCSTAIGATAHNVTARYTNSNGVAGRSTVATAGIVSMPANRMYRLPLQSGDVGVDSVESLTLSASSGVAGNLWVLLLRPVVSISVPVVSVSNVLDAFDLGFPTVSDESCLCFVHQASTTSSGLILGSMAVAKG